MWLLKFNYYSVGFSRSTMRQSLAIKALLLHFFVFESEGDSVISNKE
ncbi:MAG: hypothetical protein ACJA09_003418 [Alcanivorax sp.]|jgi:hypothetical protein